MLGVYLMAWLGKGHARGMGAKKPAGFVAGRAGKVVVGGWFGERCRPGADAGVAVFF